MSLAMVSTSMKLPRKSLKTLHAVASLESERRGCRVTWGSLVREVIQKYIVERYEAVPAGTGPETAQA
jgi:hypothetical protein